MIAIGVGPPRHSHHSQKMLHEKRHVEAKDHEPEGDFPQPLVEQPAGHLGEPVEAAREGGKYRSAEEHIMEMGYNEIGLRKLPVDRSDGKHDARQSSNHKLDQESDRKAHGSRQPNRSAPERGTPIENLYPGWH